MQPSIKSLLQDIDLERIALPEVQREFVWSENQAKDLIDSLYKGFPIGYIYLWRPKESKPFRHLENQSPLSKDPDYYLLDGQQRLTALTKMQDGEIRVKFNIDSEVFQLENAAIKNDPRWILVADVWRLGTVEIARVLRTRLGMTLEEIYEKYVPRIDKLHGVLEKELPIHEIREDDYGRIAEIYIRLNSKGTRLKKAELYLALAVLNIPTEFRSKLDTLTDEFEDWDFDANFFMRCFTCLATGQSKFEPIRDYVAQESKDKVLSVLDSVLTYLRLTLNLLNTHLGLTPEKASELMPSEVALVPLVAYLYSRKGEIKSDEEIGKLIYWFLMASYWGRYSGSTETALDADLSALRESAPLDQWIANIAEDTGRLVVQDVDLSGKFTRNKILMIYFVVQRNQGIDWFSPTDLKNTPVIELHHIFPKAVLRKIRIPDNEINDARNIAIVSDRANRRISSKEPSDYFLSENIALSRLKAQLIPENSSLWQKDNYRMFLQTRGQLIATELNSLLTSMNPNHSRYGQDTDGFNASVAQPPEVVEGWTGGSATLDQVLDVVTEMRRGSDYSMACNNVAKKRGIAVQSVRDKSTRKLGLDTAQFVEMFNAGALRGYLIDKFPSSQQHISRHFGIGEIQKPQSPSGNSTQGVKNSDFDAKVQVCSPETRAVAFELDKRIRAMDLGIQYYEHGSDIRYTHEDIAPLPAGDVHPFIHIRPNQDVLVVHVYKDVDDPKGVTKTRSADSPFQKQFDIRTESDLDDYRLGMIKQSFRLFMRRYGSS